MNLETVASAILGGDGFCPQCGTVSVDEDGCCRECGADATGKALDELANDIQVLRAQVDDLKTAGRQARDDATAALDLVSRIRMALNDNGKRMQDELLIYCRELATLPTRVAEMESVRDDRSRAYAARGLALEEERDRVAELEAENATLLVQRNESLSMVGAIVGAQGGEVRIPDSDLMVGYAFESHRDPLHHATILRVVAD